MIFMFTALLTMYGLIHIAYDGKQWLRTAAGDIWLVFMVMFVGASVLKLLTFLPHQ